MLVFASGAAGLVYQSLWMRSFGLVFGNTTDAVALVLAAFMGGLALGSALAARRSVASPLRAYALVELGIAATALAHPAAAAGASRPLRLGGTAAGPRRSRRRPRPRLRWRRSCCFPPTVLLGATVPLAVEFLSRAGRDVHEGLGRLYLVNTLGGALGVALGPFVLLPALGVRGSFVAAALVNLVIGGVAWRWSRALAEDGAPLTVREATDAPPAGHGAALPSLRAWPPPRGPSRSASR